MQHCYRWLLPKKKKRERERERERKKRKSALKNSGFFSHNKVLRRNREAMDLNLDIESQMKESNQILTNEKYLDRVGKQQPA